MIGTLRRDDGGARRFALSLAEAHVAGASVDWEALFAAQGPQAVALPTYPFQRKRYWVDAAAAGDRPGRDRARRGRAPAARRRSTNQAARADPDRPLSLQAHPWLADHAVAGAVSVARHRLRRDGLGGWRGGRLRAARGADPGGAAGPLRGATAPCCGCGSSPRTTAASARSRFTPARRRAPRGRSRSGPATPGASSSTAPSEGDEPLGAWPPPGAEPIGTDAVYDRLAEAGLDYGPAFQGLTRAWRVGEEVSPRSRWARTSPPAPLASGCTPRCSTPPSTPASSCFPARRGRSRCGTGRNVGLGATGAGSLRVRLRRGDEPSTLSLEA